MAELTSFGYRAGDSLLHRIDARFKIVLVILISLAGLNADLRALGFLTLILLGIIIRVRLPLPAALKEIRYFLILLVLVAAWRRNRRQSA